MTETLAAYKELEFVVGMRLHSLVLSVVHAIPFFAISYSKKTDELMRSLHYDFTLSAHTFSLEYFKARFITLEASKKEVQFALEAKNDTIKNAIRHTLKNIFHGLEKTTIRCEGLD